MKRFEIAAVACALGLLAACGGNKPANDPSGASTAPSSEESMSPGVSNGLPSAQGSELGSGSTTPQEAPDAPSPKDPTNGADHPAGSSK